MSGYQKTSKKDPTPIATWTDVAGMMGKVGKGNLYVTTLSNNVSYQYRIICVVGTSCWSLMIFIVNAQVMKPLFVLLCFVIPYSLMCFLWWFVYSWRTIYGSEYSACSNVDKILAQGEYAYLAGAPFLYPEGEERDNVVIQG